MNNENNNALIEENENQILNNDIHNTNSLYNNEEFFYSLKYTKITLSFMIIIFLKIIFTIYFHYSQNSENFLFQYYIITVKSQYYRCVTRYFINFGFCHFIIEIIISYIFCYFFENMIGTLFTIIMIFTSFVLISMVNLSFLKLSEYFLKMNNHHNEFENLYEGGLTPLFFTLYTFYFSFEGNSGKIFFVFFIFVIRAKHSEYILIIILAFFTPNNSQFGNISGILTGYILKLFKNFLLPKIIWIKEIEKLLNLYKLFPLYRYITEENPIMKKIINEYDNDLLNDSLSFDDSENGQQMSELISSENDNILQNY